MKQYKTLYAYTCSAGHGNFGEHKFGAESLDDAKGKVKEISLPTRCYFCPSVNLHPSSSVQLIGVEELPEYPSYTCLGYVCQCGERVVVLRIREGEGASPPPIITVSCTKGHKKNISTSSVEFLNLLHWEEKDN